MVPIKKPLPSEREGSFRRLPFGGGGGRGSFLLRGTCTMLCKGSFPLRGTCTMLCKGVRAAPRLPLKLNGWCNFLSHGFAFVKCE